MQPITLGFYKAFLPELRERLDRFAVAQRVRGFQSFAVQDLNIRPAADPIGEWVAVLTVDITGTKTAEDGELAELEDFSFSYGLHCMRAIRPIPGGGRRGFTLLWNWRLPIIDWMEDLLPSLKRRVAATSELWKEEIAAKLWSPNMLAKRLEQGGWALVEAL